MDQDPKPKGIDQPNEVEQPPHSKMYSTMRAFFEEHAVSQPESATAQSQLRAKREQMFKDDPKGRDILDPEFASAAAQLAEVLQGRPSQLELEAMSFRKRFDALKEEEVEALMDRLKQVRATVIDRGELQKGNEYDDKELWPGNVYVLESEDGSFYCLAEDLPDDIEKIGKHNHILSITADHSDGNEFGVDFYSDGTFRIDAMFAGVKAGEADLHYLIDRPTEIRDMRGYERNLVSFYLDQLQPQPQPAT